MFRSTDLDRLHDPRQKEIHPEDSESHAAVGATLCLLSPSFAADAGKATYEKSCIDCHDPAGEGSRVMDDSWRMRIPRLNSDSALSKTDAELRDIILNGKRKMPPAMAGKPETQHRTRITADQVPALIADVGSLKGR
ncbi:MAG: c-type cytochrome [Bryobacteraceae bacterium]